VLVLKKCSISHDGPHICAVAVIQCKANKVSLQYICSRYNQEFIHLLIVVCMLYLVKLIGMHE